MTADPGATGSDADVRPAEGNAIVRFERAALGYPGRCVVSDVDLEIRDGTFWFLLGPNGSGKTTLLRTILGLLPPIGGEVWRDPARAALSRIGFVPQRCAINPALPTTIREFVSLGAVGSLRPRASRADDLEWALSRVDLSGMQDRSYWSLSGGQRQRALVARALVRRPGLLVLDEANEGLDAPSEDAFLDTLDELHRSHAATLLFVSHRLELARGRATHVAVIGAGRVRAGTADEILGSRGIHEIFASAAGAAGSARSTS